MMFRPTLRGSGLYAPARVMSNDELATIVDTSDAWITERTGIRRRHIAAAQETTATLAAEAGRRALANAELRAQDIELTIVATSTPDYGFPASACLVQSALGTAGGACDLEAACSGFVYALAMASGLIGTGSIRNALVIGSEVLSRALDWTDRRTCVLFGDGAGAVVVSRSERSGPDRAFFLHADGTGADMLRMPAFGSAPTNAVQPVPTVGIQMNGPETFKFGVRVLVDSVQEAMQATGRAVSDIDWLIPHQANQRILTAAAKRLGFPEEKLVSNITEYGNTSAASIPIAIAEWVEQDRIRPGDLLLLVGFGGGLTWGSALIGWRD
jgi:3-oxoacyl-[acyl-carrier-protein] synthase-3